MRQRKFLLLGIIGAVGGAVAISFSGAAGSTIGKHANNLNKFDFYLLSTQWIPGWCEVGTGQSGADLDQIKACQQQASRPLMFHGLWPEYKDGHYPSNCNSVPPLKIDKLEFDNPFQNYLTNANSFIDHEWEKHGTCSDYYDPGLESDNQTLYYRNINRYFSLGIKNYQQIKLSTLRMETSGDEIQKMIHALNPQIPHNSTVVVCDKSEDNEQYLTGLWFCMDKKAKKFIDCPTMVINNLSCHGTMLTR